MSERAQDRHVMHEEAMEEERDTGKYLDFPHQPTKIFLQPPVGWYLERHIRRKGVVAGFRTSQGKFAYFLISDVTGNIFAYRCDLKGNSLRRSIPVINLGSTPEKVKEGLESLAQSLLNEV